jgi:Protein of unknown function (DUF4231)
LSQTGDIRGDFLPLGQKQLAARRHHRLCTALPFPRLDWSDEDSVKASLKLHDYVIDLVNSAIDWYSRRIFRDRSWSWFFRGLSYLCAVVGAVLPLIKIFGPHLDKDLGARLGDPGGITAEFALVLIALAAALNVIDRLAGFSQSWIRARAVVNQLDQARIRFELEWNDLLMRKASLRQNRSYILASADPSAQETDAAGQRANVARAVRAETRNGNGANLRGAEAATNNTENPARPPDPAPSFLESQVDLVYGFCLTVLKILGEETKSWEQEFAGSITQFSEHLQAGTLIRRHGR